ncbi:cellulase family glycosylhydrolase [Spirochaetia bacterium 38H-sp]|uniref:Cellulase family glycosylhydrolase n=1 Tax=Rarispira pelagica TaxID=3141764 RepID=A0ABU9UB93_9SPIR
MKQYGFNFLWAFSKEESGKNPQEPDKKALDFLAKHGFNFVRIPMDYRYWTNNFDYFKPDEAFFDYTDKYIEECRKRNIHICINIHRAPGYCINRNDIEKHNLWTDKEAQDAFVFYWETFAKRYKGISSEQLSFDLLNEPPEERQYGMTREIHRKVIKRTIEAIRKIDKERRIVIDGIGGGHLAMPEMADLGVVHSGRGYQPMAVSHYKAEWWIDSNKVTEAPQYPGTKWDGIIWNKESLRDFYKPWLEVAKTGVEIHIGEFGCYDKTDNKVALAWLSDLISLYKEWGWGYSLWNFEGPFGIIGHRREGARWEKIDGYLVDRDLLELLKP